MRHELWTSLAPHWMLGSHRAQCNKHGQMDWYLCTHRRVWQQLCFGHIVAVFVKHVFSLQQMFFVVGSASFTRKPLSVCQFVHFINCNRQCLQSRFVFSLLINVDWHSDACFAKEWNSEHKIKIRNVKQKIQI